jgi:8-oxo-dGTP pyrophosphatase MutT (NUDIX family)
VAVGFDQHHDGKNSQVQAWPNGRISLKVTQSDEPQVMAVRHRPERAAAGSSSVVRRAVGQGQVTPPSGERASLEAAVRAFARVPAPVTSAHRAGVGLVLVRDDAGELCFLLTRRPAGLRRHPGQFALPGGRLEPGETAEEAARRELLEELGVDLDASAVLGSLDDYVTRSGFCITPVVMWAADGVVELVPDPVEVALAFRVPIADLAVPPRFLRIPESDRPVIQVPLLGTMVHAPTAALLHQFAQLVHHGRTVRVADLEQPVFAWR